jgi:hypothetical protein
MVLVCSSAATTPNNTSWTTPSGWTLINADVTLNPGTAWYWKRAIAGDLGASVSCTYAGTASYVAALLVGAKNTVTSGSCMNFSENYSTAAITTSVLAPNQIFDLGVGVVYQQPVGSISWSGFSNTLLGSMPVYQTDSATYSVANATKAFPSVSTSTLSVNSLPNSNQYLLQINFFAPPQPTPTPTPTPTPSPGLTHMIFPG